MEFNSDCAGLEGFLFYDWDGADVNGEYFYNHMEFCKVSADGQSYSYFHNNGYEMNERYSKLILQLITIILVIFMFFFISN